MNISSGLPINRMGKVEGVGNVVSQARFIIARAKHRHPCSSASLLARVVGGVARAS
jgi:hypothetical protein